MRIMLANSRVHLGAEELIELGRPLPIHIAARQPFFLGRAPRQMGQLEFLGNIAGFLVDGLSFAFTTLGNLLDVPLKVLSQGIDLVFNGVADLLRNIPIVGDVLAEVLVLGGAIIKFGLSIPGLVLREIGNVLGGVAKALKTENSDAENDKKVNEAKDNIVEKAPVNIKDNVKAILDASGVSGGNLSPGVSSSGQVTASPATTADLRTVEAPGTGADIGTALAIGVPVIGGLILLVALT